MKPFQVLTATAASALILLSAPGTAAAAVQLDQFSVPETGSFSFISGTGLGYYYGYVEQSFTVGLDGDLDRIDVGVSNQGSAAGGVRFDLMDAGGGALASVQTPITDLPEHPYWNYAGLMKFDLSSAGISVASGDLLRFRLTPYDDGGAFIDGIGQSEYSGGSVTTGGDAYPYDLAFRTYVNVSAVPEPGVWALVIVGFGLAGGALRAGRRSTAAAPAAGWSRLVTRPAHT